MFLFPGDRVRERCTNTSIGLIKENVPDLYRVSAAGPLLSIGGANYWINYRQVSYSPLLDDIVLGVVKGRGKGHYKVDLGGPSCAVVDHMDFPNATKRNRPVLLVGDVILAQVTEDALHADTRVSCRTEAVKEMGVLKGGALIKCGILKSRHMFLFPPKITGTAIEQIIFGLNGYAWVFPSTHEAIRDSISLVI